MHSSLRVYEWPCSQVGHCHSLCQDSCSGAQKVNDVNYVDKKVYDWEGRQEEQRIVLKLVLCLQCPLFVQNRFYKEMCSFSSNWNSIWGKAGQALQSLGERLSVRVEPQALSGELCVEKSVPASFGREAQICHRSWPRGQRKTENSREAPALWLSLKPS